MSYSALPPPTVDQAYFTLSALEAGKIHLPERLYITDFDESIVRRCPTLSFLLHHSKTGKRTVFDLGLRKDLTWPPKTMDWVRVSKFVLEVPQDVADSLRQGGMQPEEVDYVILSHIHFDHSGDSTPFSKAKFLLGGESEALLKTGFPANPDSNFFQDTVPLERTEFLYPTSTGWAPLGPFPHVLDYFGDGSLYLVDAPGHVDGHLNALVRTGPAEGDWIYLAGDTAHDVRLLDGARQICVYHDGGSAHVDHIAAAEHIKRVRSLRDDYGVKILLAHAYRWDEDRKDTYFPNTFKS